VPITGTADVDADLLVFHAGTRRDSSGTLRTTGGRVLTLVARGATLAAAQSRVYANIARMRFEGAQWRTDIAARELA
jgi:phosphoribosylamine--glycine ligase